MIVYARRNIEKAVKYSLERPLPSRVRVLVKAGQEVVPETIVAVGKKPAGYRRVDLARLLKVRPEKVKLVKTVGSRVYKGDLVARTSKLWGIKEWQFRSPLEGVLVDYDPQKAWATFEYLPESESITAGMWGRVAQVVPRERIVIRSLADCIMLLLSSGSPREGSLVQVGHDDLPLEPRHLNSSHRHKIIFGGTQAGEEFYQQALKMGVRGVITGGIDYQTFLRLMGPRGSLEDIGLTVGVTEGFGAWPIEEKLHSYLKEKEGQFVFFDGLKGEVVIPRSEEKVAVGKASLQQTETRRFVKVKQGQRARILVGEHRGRYGKVETSSGTRVKIRLGQKLVEVLPENVEVLLEGLG